MKCKLSLLLIAVMAFLVWGATAVAQHNSQSLGAYARSIRRSKPEVPASSAPKVYDNDNMPEDSSISVVGSDDSSSAGDQTTDQPKTDDNTAAAKDQKDKKDKLPQITPGQFTEDRQKAFDAWKDKLNQQKEKIAQISKELDLLQREYRVKAAEFYADTAQRAQNPTAFAKEDADYKKRIGDKQQSLKDAQSKLSDLQDEARRQGAPNSVIEQ